MSYKNNVCVVAIVWIRFTFDDIRSIRERFWNSPKPIRMQKLIEYVESSQQVGKSNFIKVTALKDKNICSRAFQKLFRVNKNTFSRAAALTKDGAVFFPTKKPRDVSEHSVRLMAWMETYTTYSGDRMPNSKDILMPYGTTKCNVYKKYCQELEDNSLRPVSLASFHKIWKLYFPHVKAKKVS